MDREALLRAKNSDTYGERKKKTIILLVVWIVVCFAIGFAGLPMVWFFGLAIWPIVLIVQFLKLNKLKKQIAHKMEDGEFIEVGAEQRQESSPTRTSEHTQARKDPVSNLAAYALGRAVTNRQNQPAKRTVKFDPRFSRTCATCEYWGGERGVVTRLNLHETECESKRINGRCGNRSAAGMYFGYNHSADSRCKDWVMWNQL